MHKYKNHNLNNNYNNLKNTNNNNYNNKIKHNFKHNNQKIQLINYKIKYNLEKMIKMSNHKLLKN